MSDQRDLTGRARQSRLLDIARALQEERARSQTTLIGSVLSGARPGESVMALGVDGRRVQARAGDSIYPGQPVVVFDRGDGQLPVVLPSGIHSGGTGTTSGGANSGGGSHTRLDRSVDIRRNRREDEEDEPEILQAEGAYVVAVRRYIRAAQIGVIYSIVAEPEPREQDDNDFDGPWQEEPIDPDYEPVDYACPRYYFGRQSVSGTIGSGERRCIPTPDPTAPYSSYTQCANDPDNWTYECNPPRLPPSSGGGGASGSVAGVLPVFYESGTRRLDPQGTDTIETSTAAPSGIFNPGGHPPSAPESIWIQSSLPTKSAHPLGYIVQNTRTKRFYEYVTGHSLIGRSVPFASRRNSGQEIDWSYASAVNKSGGVNTIGYYNDYAIRGRPSLSEVQRRVASNGRLIRLSFTGEERYAFYDLHRTVVMNPGLFEVLETHSYGTSENRDMATEYTGPEYWQEFAPEGDPFNPDVFRAVGSARPAPRGSSPPPPSYTPPSGIPPYCDEIRPPKGIPTGGRRIFYVGGFREEPIELKTINVEDEFEAYITLVGEEWKAVIKWGKEPNGNWCEVETFGGRINDDWQKPYSESKDPFPALQGLTQEYQAEDANIDKVHSNYLLTINRNQTVLGSNSIANRNQSFEDELLSVVMNNMGDLGNKKMIPATVSIAPIINRSTEELGDAFNFNGAAYRLIYEDMIEDGMEVVYVNGCPYLGEIHQISPWRARL